MNSAAIRQVLKTLQQFKTSEIHHEYTDFSLRYCGHTDTFIIIYLATQEIEEHKDLDTCASVIEKLIRESESVK